MTAVDERRQAGQAVAEFALAIIVFLVLVMTIFDLGRGVFAYNGVSEAAREIARRTSVYPGIVLGQSQESQTTIAVQQGLVPGMQAVATGDFECIDVAGSAIADVPCPSGAYVKVTVRASYQPISILALIVNGGGPFTLSSASTVKIP